MRTRFDQLGKGIFGGVGELLGRVSTQYEIPGEVQAADIMFWPDGDRALERGSMGLMGRMLAVSCMIECFHDTPSALETRSCIAKLFNLHRHLARQPGELASELAEAGSGDDVLLWIVSAGRPESVLDRWLPLFATGTSDDIARTVRNHG